MRADQTPRPSRRRCTARFHHAYSFSAIRNSEYTAAKNAAIWGQFTPANHDTRKPPAATPLAVSHAGLSRIIIDQIGRASCRERVDPFARMGVSIIYIDRGIEM